MRDVQPGVRRFGVMSPRQVAGFLAYGWAAVGNSTRVRGVWQVTGFLAYGCAAAVGNPTIARVRGVWRVLCGGPARERGVRAAR